MLSSLCYTYGDPEAETVLLQIGAPGESEEVRSEWEQISASVSKPVRMILFPVSDWNSELSPWQAPPAFGKEPFSGGAAETLARIQSGILPELRNREIYIGGYSLAGLFALWAAYETDAFQGVCAASPSVWFPDWIRYIGERKIRTRKVYLSLGDREEKTKNPVLSRVGDCIRKQHEILLREQVPVLLEWNRGNHFQNAPQRTARGFSTLIGMRTETVESRKEKKEEEQTT